MDIVLEHQAELRHLNRTRFSRSRDAICLGGNDVDTTWDDRLGVSRAVRARRPALYCDATTARHKRKVVRA
jgi:hypothetical protein